MNEKEFEEFQHEALHASIDLNEKISKDFHISDFPRYDYNLHDGTLVFSKDEVPFVIATIQVVGTTSKSAGTWLWGWANDWLPSHVTQRMRAVRAFGEKEEIPKLTKPSWPDDEYLGWEMTSISVRILGAHGSYRCPGTDGFIYFVYLDIREANEEDRAKWVERTRGIECDQHGRGFPTYICEHLFANPNQKWFSNPPEESDPWPDAWCSKCEVLFQEEGEWNERNEERTKIKMVCHYCYESKRSLKH